MQKNTLSRYLKQLQNQTWHTLLAVLLTCMVSDERDICRVRKLALPGGTYLMFSQCWVMAEKPGMALLLLLQMRMSSSLLALLQPPSTSSGKAPASDHVSLHS